ncbi:Zn-ribbon domain-containing OB-fold protein [Brumicola pallidula]|uniref:ChsH2 C-terminal OB-fold domain-containing protein n=1 Tax=Brumicola pallidula DSM 14239 = ACAM 615 TaxID=1121922 RepID=K6Y8D3_9ALTE|nr:OB-fold domain-containing protein [Glaciecola pallidula]GAC29019.1 hypothetical protein GPAL_2158 [Glaciecola pallidula DSM 14239 = ACAM 615]
MNKFIDNKILSGDKNQFTLLAGHCQICSRLYFPTLLNCSVCETDLKEYKLPKKGTIWSWTTQHFQPKNPPYDDKQGIESFQPFCLGIIDLNNELRITAKLIDVTTEDIYINMPVELVQLPFKSFRNGNDVTTFAFQPIKK